MNRHRNRKCRAFSHSATKRVLKKKQGEPPNPSQELEHKHWMFYYFNGSPHPLFDPLCFSSYEKQSTYLGLGLGFFPSNNT